jgi:hypothetical protein
LAPGVTFPLTSRLASLFADTFSPFPLLECEDLPDVESFGGGFFRVGPVLTGAETLAAGLFPFVLSESEELLDVESFGGGFFRVGAALAGAETLAAGFFSFALSESEDELDDDFLAAGLAAIVTARVTGAGFFFFTGAFGAGF